MIVSLSILSAPLLNLHETIQKALDYGIDRLHLDVMDGHYVPRIAFGHDWARAINQHFPNLPIDAHLMVSPTQLAHRDSFLASGVKRLWLHPHTTHPELQKTHKHWVLCLDEPLSTLPKHTTEVLLMAVTPGSGGQDLNPQVFDTIQSLRKTHPNLYIAVDGGVNRDNIRALKEAQVHEVILGKGLLSDTNPKAVVSMAR